MEESAINITKKLDGAGYICKICFLDFKRRSNATRHVQTKHSNQNMLLDKVAGTDNDDFNNDSYNNEFDPTMDYDFLTENFAEEDLQKTISDGSSSEIEKRRFFSEDNNNLNQKPKGPKYDTISDSDITDSESDRVSSDGGVEEYSDDEFESIDDLRLYPNSKIPVKEHAAAVFGYSIRHNCSRQSISDLLQLIQLHVPENNRASKSYASLKRICNGWDTENIKVIEYCELCYVLWPIDEPNNFNCATNNCKGLRYLGKDQSKKRKKCYFLTCSIQSQIKSILEREGMWEKISKIVDQRQTETHCYRDITDGSEYRRLCKNGEILYNNSNLTCTFNTDGVALFKSSRIEIRPMFIAINEIPPKERFQCKNIVLWGLWQGRGKPPTYTFTKPFVEDMKDLAENGVELSIIKNKFEKIVNVKLFAITSSMDLIAKAQFLNMIQHNGGYGCKDCLTKGDHIPSGKGFAHCYTYAETVNAERREDDSLITDAIEAYESDTVVNGIKAVSCLLTLPQFSVVKGVVIDYMHGILLGVTKALLLIWFEPAEHRSFYKANKTYPDYFIGHEQMN